MKLKYFFSLWAVVLPVVATCQTDEDSVVFWKDFKQLAYSDFRGVPNPAFLVYGTPSNAATASRIQLILVENEGKIEIQVINTFMRYESWMKIKDSISLMHEQEHFNISEIYARKIRKDVSQLSLSERTPLNIKQIFDRYLKERSDFQKLYDDETHHGFISDKQAYWIRKIHRDIKNLSGFSATHVN